MRNPKFDALLRELEALHDSKNHDYADAADPLSNLRACEAFGVDPVVGTCVRMSDKWARIQQLIGGKHPQHEGLRDSLIDLAVYSLLAVLLVDARGYTATQQRGWDTSPAQGHATLRTHDRVAHPSARRRGH
jgi:hypothetical protein